MATSAPSPALPVPARRPGAPIRRSGAKSQGEVELDDHYLIALAKQGRKDAYDRIVKRYFGFVRLKASSYFLIGGDSDATVNRVIRHNAGWTSNPNPVEPMRNASTRCARAPVTTSHWQRSVLPRSPTTGTPSMIWVLVAWRCCCPRYRRTSHCDYSTTTPPWSISIVGLTPICGHRVRRLVPSD